MAGKADFTEEEWDALQKGVTGSGMLVSVAHRDFTDSFGEAKAIAKDLAANSDNASQLVRELAETHGTGFGLVASPTEVNEGTMTALATAVATLTAKAPDELEAYRAFVLEWPTRSPRRRAAYRRRDGSDRQDHGRARRRVGSPRHAC